MLLAIGCGREGVNRSTSSFVNTTKEGIPSSFISSIWLTFTGVIRTFVFLLPLLRVDKSDFPQSQSAQLQQCLSTEEDEKPLSVHLLSE